MEGRRGRIIGGSVGGEGNRAAAPDDDGRMNDREGFGSHTRAVIGACIEVHKELGPGLLEAAYEECVARELAERGIPFLRQPALPLIYKGHRIERAYQPDFIVDGRVVLEIKAVQSILPVHLAQLRTYAKLRGLRLGLLVNFNVPALRQRGIRRINLSPPRGLPVSPSIHGAGTGRWSGR